ncbi:MAG: mismatch-specific DNA-glycosylase [Microthrixaceae bacterium]
MSAFPSSQQPDQNGPRLAAPNLRSWRPLPYANRSLSTVYCDSSFLEVPMPWLPLCLWDLHRVLQVDGTAYLSTSGAISGWYQDELFLHLIEGAGFTLQAMQADTVPNLPQELALRCDQTLADTVGPRMRLLLIGLNPSLNAAAAGVAFCTSSNRAWPALAAAGLCQAGITNAEQDPAALLMTQGIGMTDLVKRASARAEQINPQEFRTGLTRLVALCQLLQPRAVCVLGLSGWRQAVGKPVQAGIQDIQLAGRPVYLMPNPSGLNTHTSLAALTEHFEFAAAIADEH